MAAILKEYKLIHRLGGNDQKFRKAYFYSRSSKNALLVSNIRALKFYYEATF